MSVFSFSEAYGPFNCESCSINEAWDCLLTDEDEKKLKERSGPKAAKQILEDGIGKILCEDCLNIHNGG